MYVTSSRQVILKVIHARCGLGSWTKATYIHPITSNMRLLATVVWLCM